MCNATYIDPGCTTPCAPGGYCLLNSTLTVQQCAAECADPILRNASANITEDYNTYILYLEVYENTLLPFIQCEYAAFYCIEVCEDTLCGRMRYPIPPKALICPNNNKLFQKCLGGWASSPF